MKFIKNNFFKIISIALFLIVLIMGKLLSDAYKIENKITLPTYSYIDLKEYGFDYITVKGTLTSDDTDNGVASKLNTNTFTCDRSIKSCSLVQAEIFSGSMLSTYTETLPIKSWDDNFIVFQTTPKTGQCVIWTYRIDRVKKELIGVREQAGNYDYDKCMGIGADKFEIRLVDGWDVVSVLRRYKKD